MEVDLKLDVKNPKAIDKRFFNKKILEFSSKAKELLENNIREVYEINSKIRVKGNYVPLEEMLSSIRIEYHPNEYSFSIGIDEDLIEWKDKLGEDIYQVDQKGNEEDTVTNLDEHWRTPIDGEQEDDWFLGKTVEELSKYIQNNFQKAI